MGMCFVNEGGVNGLRSCGTGVLISGVRLFDGEGYCFQLENAPVCENWRGLAWCWEAVKLLIT